MALSYINHIALVLDGSGSMAQVQDTAVKVADQLIAHLAERSREMDQETRVTVYVFDYPNHIQCLFYDKDVLRLPSLKGHYRTVGQTALVDATLQAVRDLKKTATLYGDHSFLVYVLTDGAENASVNTPSTLAIELEALPDNWTVAAFVPNMTGMHEAKQYGFPKENIGVWETTERGLSEVGSTIRRATDNYMTARSKGVRGTKNLFTLQTDTLWQAPDIAALAPAILRRLKPGQFRKLRVSATEEVARFVERELGRPYVLGEAFYQLMVPVKVQAQKSIALYSRKDHTVYVGKEARQLLGLPDHEVRVQPTAHLDYDIFIQSTSVNRKLLVGTDVILISPSVQ